MPNNKPVVFVDFDGTITRRDTTDAILEAFADPRWLRVEEEWTAGRIGSRECLLAQMALVDAAVDDVDALLDSVSVDEGFVPLMQACATHQLPVHIVSDGFDYCIRRVLWRPSLNLAPHLSGIQIVSSRLAPEGRRWRASFAETPCIHGCATCKPATMDRLVPDGPPIIYIGDGLSDRHAASVVDVLFAKGSLATHCDAHAIAYLPYSGLADVASQIHQLLLSEVPLKGRDLQYE